MAARSSGGRAAALRQKNSEMAAMMKRLGIERHTANCPLCHRLVARQTFKSMGSMYSHILGCKGRSKQSR